MDKKITVEQYTTLLLAGERMIEHRDENGLVYVSDSIITIDDYRRYADDEHDVMFSTDDVECVRFGVMSDKWIYNSGNISTWVFNADGTDLGVVVL